jgi:hypothetical protein
MEPTRRYQFTWELLGDLGLGRPNLGHYTRLEVYRLMQFCFRDVLEQRLGSQQTDRIFYEAGKLAGGEFYKHTLSGAADFNKFIRQLQSVLKEMSIGISREKRRRLGRVCSNE